MGPDVRTSTLVTLVLSRDLDFLGTVYIGVKQMLIMVGSCLALYGPILQ